MKKAHKDLEKHTDTIKGFSSRNLQALDNSHEDEDRIARLSIDLLVSDHKRLKMAATIMQMSMKDFVIMSVGDFMQRKLSRLTKNLK